MSVPSSPKNSNDEVIARYLQCPFWTSPEVENELLSVDCVLDYPFAPPGMPKTFDSGKRVLLVDWLRRTSKNESREKVTIYPTKNPGHYWVESTLIATVTWGGSTQRSFIGEQMERITIENGKITHVRSWVDPVAYYLAAGINLPVFYFDAKFVEPTTMPVVPSKFNPTNEEEEREARQYLFDYFFKPDFFDEERDTAAKANIHDPDFKLKMPFMPAGMAREYDPYTKASTMEWVHRTLLAWDQSTDFPRDEFVNPDVAIVEINNSHGMLKWDPRGNTSGYWNDYCVFVSLKGFRLKEFREYLDPINKLLAAGASIPVFPFFY